MISLAYAVGTVIGIYALVVLGIEIAVRIHARWARSEFEGDKHDTVPSTRADGEGL